MRVFKWIIKSLFYIGKSWKAHMILIYVFLSQPMMSLLDVTPDEVGMQSTSLWTALGLLIDVLRQPLSVFKLM